MSINYEIKEHMVVTDTAEHSELIGMAVSDYLKLSDNNTISNAVISRDNQTTVFESGYDKNQFASIVNSLVTANKVDISIEYSYNTDIGEIDIFEISDYVKSHMDENTKDLFYSLYNNSDCEEDAGVLTAYGFKNGTYYNGIVEYNEVDSIPDGKWVAVTTAVCYDTEDSNDNMKAIDDVCRQMCEFSEYDDLYYSNGDFTFNLNNLVINNDSELKGFLSLCRKLHELTDGECYFEINLVDFSSAEARLLNVEFDEEGNPIIYTANI